MRLCAQEKSHKNKKTDATQVFHLVTSVIMLQNYYPTLRYSLGDIPTRRLKYLPKKVCDGKLSSSLIC